MEPNITPIIPIEPGRIGVRHLPWSIVALIADFGDLGRRPAIVRGLGRHYTEIMTPGAIRGAYDLTKCSEINLDDALDKLPLLVNITRLDCHGTRITLIPPTLANLTWLDCHETAITLIPPTLVNLTWLDCQRTGITEIPNLVTLKTLDCDWTQITVIPNTLVNLEWLSCCFTEITEIPNTLFNLKELDCSRTSITEIPNTLVNLKYSIKSVSYRHQYKINFFRY